MSATTQEDTFFIKGLRLSVDAVQHPLVDKNYTWSGEKMILIPDSICENVDTDDLLKYVITAKHDFGIAVLTPSFEKSKKYEKMGGVLANIGSSGKSTYVSIPYTLYIVRAVVCRILYLHCKEQIKNNIRAAIISFSPGNRWLDSAMQNSYTKGNKRALSTDG